MFPVRFPVGVPVRLPVRSRAYSGGGPRRGTAAALPLLLLLTACGGAVPPFDESRLLDRIAVLSSDEFGGRAPGSPGEDLTVTYLSRAFAEAGLEPGNPDGTYVQQVPLVGMTTTEMTASSEPGGAWRPGEEFVAWTKRVIPQVRAAGELVFVGYGVTAPEYGWDDFSDASGPVDLAGKILVALVGDPPGEEHFGGAAMTYYGRWTYKFDRAAEAGALGALIVHETGPAGYPWEVVSGSWSGEQFDLRTPNGGFDRLEIEGWISRERAEALFAAAGEDFDEAKAAALSPDFSPRPLGVEAEFSLTAVHRELDSANVVARLTGAEAPEETVLYTAHWDHLGTAEVPEGEDGIYNGAFDNATGTAGLVALAETFAADRPPRRSVLFLAVTAEEQGLLGSRHYAENPLYPTASTVAALNMDGMNVWGVTRDLTVIGLGQSELDDLAAEVAAGQGRVLRPDPEPEKGFYYRSDHFEFAKVGVPAFYPDGGIDFIGKPEGYGLEARGAYVAEAYHKPADEVQDWYDLAGMAADLEFLYRMGRRLADSADWPEWSENSEFRARRQADRP